MNHNQNKLRSIESATHVVMFWLLTLMAVALFVPCVLVPIWVENEAVREHEQKLTEYLVDLDRQADKNEARIDALLTDPLVNQRIIRRELNYRSEGEQVVCWPVSRFGIANIDPPYPVVESSLEDTADDVLQNLVGSMNRWLPRWPWRKLFAEAPSRHVLLFMAGGLLISAFLLYGPPKDRLAP